MTQLYHSTYNLYDSYSLNPKVIKSRKGDRLFICQKLNANRVEHIHIQQFALWSRNMMKKIFKSAFLKRSTNKEL